MGFKVIIVGAVAAGTRAAAHLKRLKPEAEVVLVDRQALVSYSGCGLPYFISGDVNDARELMNTTYMMLKDESFFERVKGVTLLTRTEALALDRKLKKIRVRSLETNEEKDLDYDQLVLATGGRPIRLEIPGADLPGVITVSNLAEAVKLREQVAAGRINRAVIIGGGPLALQMAEALSDLWGVETALIAAGNQLLSGLVGPQLAGMVRRKLDEHELREVYLGERVKRVEEGEDGLRVITSRRELETDLVMTALGVRPDSDLALAAGLELTPGGAVAVNSRFQTSDPDIYAGGDCVENVNLLTGRGVYLSSGALASRHGRIIGTNLAGAIEEHDGVSGGFLLKVFDAAVGAVGLSLSRAREEGFDAASALVTQADRDQFYPGWETMHLELIFDRTSGRVLGLAGFSPKGEALAARLNAVAAILKYQPGLRDVANLELAYAPPFGAAVDILHVAACAAENIMAGKNRVMDVDEFAALFSRRQEVAATFLDVRGRDNAEPYLARYPGDWINLPLDELRARIGELPRDRKIILICNSGVRSYEAQVILDQAGLVSTYNVQGGLGAARRWGLELV
ncbi:MAG: FAD-dependent oxidoreductase [Thermodesulfobacteriota bacterium]